MAQTKARVKEAPETRVPEMSKAPYIGAFAELQKAAFGPGNWFGTAWLECLGEVNAEFAQFAADRIRDDVRTQHEILHCRDATRLRDIQTRFIDRAVAQYTAETGKLVEISQDFLARLAKGRDA